MMLPPESRGVLVNIFDTKKTLFAFLTASLIVFHSSCVSSAFMTWSFRITAGLTDPTEKRSKTTVKLQWSFSGQVCFLVILRYLRICWPGQELLERIQGPENASISSLYQANTCFSGWESSMGNPKAGIIIRRSLQRCHQYGIRHYRLRLTWIGGKPKNSSM